MIGRILRILHFEAPSYLGGWDGKSKVDICSHLTNLRSSFWLMKSEDCEIIIEENYKKNIRVLSSLGTLLFFFVALKDIYFVSKTMVYQLIKSYMTRNDNKKIYDKINDNHN